MALVKAENVSNQFNGFSGLPVFRQLGLMIGLAASVALGVAIVMWSQTPSYRLLFNNLSAQDSAQVVDALQKSGMEYKLDEADGSVWVAGDALHEARMKLASQGLPEGTGVGFELMDGKDGFGSSQFMESVRYQRALEGELSRTISTLKSVQSARVHLAIPKQSVFVRNRKKSSASVTVSLYPGRNLEPGQIQAIVNLVSSSVPELESGMITVVDQQGRLLTDEPDSGMVFSAKQLDYKRQIENGYMKRIEDILTPIVGPGKVKAQVNTELDFTVTEQTQEVFNPDQVAMRSEQTMEEMRGGSEGMAAGVPGALSNQPPEGGTLGNGEAPPSMSQPAVTNSTRRATRNFEVDKTISHTRLATGTIRRLSVAVLVDNKASATGEGTPYTDEEIQRFVQLVQDAVGFSVQRGDRINVLNAAFTVVPEPEPLPEEPIWKQAWVLEMGKQLLGAIAILVLVFTVLRPVMHELAKKGVDMRELAKKIGHGEAFDDEDDDTVTLSGKETARQLQQQTHEAQLSTAMSMVDQDPRTVAQVLKNWVGNDAG
ncbi:flagellar basal-body MS-ring/collar protein FliF [Sulfuriflexus mobilis]|uniref:flagellar basal-body MS-ring/collar protein FliF n=1 Tax=Sulfuriflexus mobilis TaxID=1811807 RepID=UPI000F81D11A|nr:flagellar basal-body MS-ring/collar protein FliF [Sulfuriflexus mobilis]